jgi:diguanylate cyclase (GGDEF)-like protein/PAS domain S-box-containing protein
MLFADKPEMEGKNMLGLKNHEGRFVVKGMIDVVQANQEGFYEYSWTKPKRDEAHFKKISYIKRFEPYDWFIGTGLYLDDMEQQVKEEILNDTERLLFDKESKNYIFAGTWKGMSLSHPAKGKDMYNVKDVNGKYIVQELISRAGSGGGFVEYVMPPLKGERNLNKLSYVAGIHDWEWYVGAGIYLDDISEQIQQLNNDMKDELEKTILSILAMVAGFSLLLAFFYFHISAKIRRDFHVFTYFFDSLVKKDQKIDMNTIKFQEFEELALHANAMLQTKMETDIYLERYKKIVSSSDDLLSFIDKNYVYLAVSEGYLHFFEKTKEEIIGHSMPELFGVEYFEKELKAISDRALTGESFEREYWIKSPSGEYRYLHTKYFPHFEKESTEVLAYVVSARDVTDKKLNEEKLIASEKELDFLAHNDSLTGLPNRILLHDRISHAIFTCNRNGLMVALCFVDLDNFKKINDSFGHSYGDDILKQFATRIQNLVRSCDTLSRIGGDEFILLVENVKEKSEIERIVEKIQSVFEEPFLVNEQKFFLSASIGISVYPDHGLDSETLIKNADTAMYKAKDSGKNTYAFYSLEMTIASYERIGMENALREAIKRREFLVYYQPQMDLVTGDLVGVEALVRWNHPEEGILAPSRFIHFSEETRLIIDIGAFVLEQACLDMLLLERDGLFHGTISVNISGVQIEYSDFLQTLQTTIASTGIIPSRLDIEVTESFIMNDPERWIELLKNIQGLGVTIAIDDFGTGHSSLSYLSKLPIDKLKVDMSFVRDIPKQENACAIVNSIIDLAQNMKIATLAEGIETKEQEGYLREHGCMQGQGYLYGKPMNLKDLKVWIMKRQK